MVLLFFCSLAFIISLPKSGNLLNSEINPFLVMKELAIELYHVAKDLTGWDVSIVAGLLILAALMIILVFLFLVALIFKRPG